MYRPPPSASISSGANSGTYLQLYLHCRRQRRILPTPPFSPPGRAPRACPDASSPVLALGRGAPSGWGKCGATTGGEGLAVAPPVAERGNLPPT